MKRLLLFILLATLLTACDKNVAEECSEPSTCKNGFMVWGGDPALDGLGWYFTETLTNSNKVYKFDNLPLQFQEDKLPVSVCFFDTGKKYGCFCVVPLPLYHITDIRRQTE